MTSNSVTFNWQGTSLSGGDFNDPAAWRQDAVPGSADVALFGNPEDVQGGIVSGNAAIGELLVTANTHSLHAAPRYYFSGTITATGVGTAASVMIGGQATATLTGSASLLAAGIDIAQGTLSALGGSVRTELIQADSVAVGAGREQSGDLSVAAGAVLTDGTSLLVGLRGSGSVQLGGAAFIGSPSQGGDMRVGTGLGGVGVVEVGGSASLQIAGTLALGGAGSAQLSIGTDAVVSAGAAVLVDHGSDVFLVQGELTAPRIDIAPGAAVLGSGELGSYLSQPLPATTNAGTIQATGTLFVAGTITSLGGTLAVGAHADLMAEGVVGRATLAFLGRDGYLGVQGVDNGTRVVGFQPGDRIYLSDATSLTFNDTTGIMTLSLTGGGTEQLHVSGQFAGDTFSIRDGLITLQRDTAHPGDAGLAQHSGHIAA